MRGRRQGWRQRIILMLCLCCFLWGVDAEGKSTKTNQAFAAPEGRCTLAGAELQDDQFSFVIDEISDSGTVKSEAVSVGTNRDDGRILFSTINYDQNDIGTHFYRVYQINSGADEIYYDAREYHFQVEVMESTEGVQVSEPVYKEDEIHFANTYRYIEVDINGQVSLVFDQDGDPFAPMTDGMFGFYVWENMKAADADRTVGIGTSMADHTIVFTPLQFRFNDIEEYNVHDIRVEQTSCYDYAIINNSPQASGEIRIMRNEETGELSSIVDLQPQFRKIQDVLNPMEMYLETTVSIKKDGEIRPPEKAGQYYFLARDAANGTVYAAATNDADGNVKFPPIFFLDAGEYHLNITQCAATDVSQDTGTVLYDEHLCHVTVTATGNGPDHMTIESIIYEEGEDQYCNELIQNSLQSLNMPVSVGLEDQSGTVLSVRENEFAFGLWTKDGQLAAVGTNRSDGQVRLGMLYQGMANVGQPGVAYSLRQIPNSTRGVVWDGQEYAVQISAKESKGKVSIQYGLQDEKGNAVNSAEFLNQYIFSPIQVNLEGKVSLCGRSIRENEFSFLVYGKTGDEAGKPIDSPSCHSDGRISFDPISIDKPGIYQYEIRQKKGNNPGITTYDETVFSVTIKVEAGEDHILTVTEIDYAAPIMFENIYSAKAVAVTLTSQMKLLGGSLGEGEYIFALKEGDQIVAKAKNQADGTIVFPEMVFDKAGTYHYVIAREIDQKEKQKENLVIPVTVEITDDYVGNLNASVIYPEQNTVFEVVYQKESGTETQTTTSSVNQKNKNGVKTGDDSRTSLWIIAGFGACFVMGGVLYIRKKENMK